jgi:hypothetical protein
LLRRGPLRTARAAFTASSSSEPRDGPRLQLQVPELAQVPIPRRREDPLPQPPYVVLVGPPVDGVPTQGIARRSVHRGVQLALRYRRICSASLHSSPAHVSVPFGTQALGPGIRPVIQQRLLGGAATIVVVSCWLSPTGSRFLGILFPPGGFRHSLRLAYRSRRSGPDSVGVPVFRTCETRPGWVPSLLRGGGVVPAIVTSMTGACRFSTASPLPRWNIPSAGAGITKHTKIHSRSPVRSSPCPPSSDGT